MSKRMTLDTAPDGFLAMQGLEKYIARCGLPPGLVELVKLRVSTINGCAYCIDMHWRRLRAAGETEARLYGLAVWRELGGYTARERAALGWAESVTHSATSRVPDAIYAEALDHFAPKELADLTYVVATINAWNRLCVAFRVEPDEARPSAPSK